MRISVTKDLTPLREAAKRRIDAEAERQRQMILTPGAGQAMVYQAKQTEALLYVLDGTVGPLMAAEAARIGGTAADVAALWQMMRSAWIDRAAEIETLRLDAKDAVDAATTPAEISAAETPTY